MPTSRAIHYRERNEPLRRVLGFLVRINNILDHLGGILNTWAGSRSAHRACGILFVKSLRPLEELGEWTQWSCNDKHWRELEAISCKNRLNGGGVCQFRHADPGKFKKPRKNLISFSNDLSASVQRQCDNFDLVTLSLTTRTSCAHQPHTAPTSGFRCHHASQMEHEGRRIE